jgi:hypothetical protein
MRQDLDPRELTMRVNLRQLIKFCREGALTDEQTRKLVAQLVGDEAERAAAIVWGKYERAAQMSGVYLNNSF